MLTLGEGLKKYTEQGFRSFHTPGHKGKREFFLGLDFPEQDLTELPGLDMLHAAQGIIAEAQKRAAEVFGADETFFLINGATSGNQAMFLALEDTPGKKVLVERQSHRSVMAGLVLSGLVPEYIPPVIHPEFNLPLGLNLPETPIQWENIVAVHITYPSYYGTVTDLSWLIKARNKKAHNLPVLVDQAHGSHYLTSLFPPSALSLGADLVLHSSHKTLSALTQAAMLHVQGSNIPRNRLKQALELLQSSSPSYLLLASLERAVKSALEHERWEALYEEVQRLHKEIGEFLRILDVNDAGTNGIASVDWSKILVNTRPIGIPAPVCVDYMREKFRIEPELWDEENILFILGIGNTPEDVRLLVQGLKGLANLKNEAEAFAWKKQNPRKHSFHESGLPYPPQRMSPREAFFARKRQVPLKEALGLIVGESISPYPPGIPVIVMGEEMTPEVWEFLLSIEGGRWQGWDDVGKKIWVIEEG